MARVQTLGNSLNVSLRAGYLSVRTAWRRVWQT